MTLLQSVRRYTMSKEGSSASGKCAAGLTTAESQAALMAWRPLKPEQGQTGLSGQGSFTGAMSKTPRTDYCNPNRVDEGCRALP